MFAIGQQQTSNQQPEVSGKVCAWDPRRWGAQVRSQHLLRWAVQIMSFELILRELSPTILGLRGM